MSECLVTIVTITKNHYKGLCETLESVKNQDYLAIEHIVIDGDSNDGTKELLQSYSHSKTYIYVSEPDNGISSAFNKGLDKANGNLIFFLNSGDCLASNTIISQVVESYIENKWICAQGGVIAPDRTRKEVIYTPPKIPSYFLHYFMFLPHQGFFCQNLLHRKYRFDESIKTSMDYDLFLRMLQGITIFYLPRVITRCEAGGGVAGNWHLRVIEQSRIRMKYASTILEKIIVSCINLMIYLKNFFKIDSPFARRWEAKQNQ